MEDLKEVLRQEPNSRLGLYYMAQTNFGLGLADEARAVAAELDRTYPDYLPGKLMQLQLTLFGADANGQRAAINLANDLLTRLSKTAPDRENSPQVLGEIQEKTYLARGTAQMHLKNYPAARQDFETARQIAPKDPAVYNSLAVVALEENKPEEALAAFENALQVDATNFAALEWSADPARKKQPGRPCAKQDRPTDFLVPEQRDSSLLQRPGLPGAEEHPGCRS